MEKQTRKNFYDRFVDENKLASIGDYELQRKYYSYYFTFYAFCGCTATLPTFFGYNFKELFTTILFIFSILFFVIAIFCLEELFYYDSQYSVIRNRKHMLLLSLPPIVMTIAMDVAAIFTTKFILLDNGTYEIQFDPFFYFFIFFPLYIGYLIFLYYAFLKCFAKYSKKPKKDKNKKVN